MQVYVWCSEPVTQALFTTSPLQPLLGRRREAFFRKSSPCLTFNPSVLHPFHLNTFSAEFFCVEALPLVEIKTPSGEQYVRPP